jgi:pre-rRNA-processing protein TSR2
MPPEHHAAFREGLLGLLARWTALQLAVANEWGGADSLQKFRDAGEELCEWFLGPKKTSKVAEDLEELLEEILGDDFCVQCEDGSPREVARIACDMYERCRVGDYSVAADVCAKPLPRESVENSRRVEEDRRWTAGAAGAAGDGGGSDDDGGSEEDAEAMDADDLAAGLGEFSMRDGGDAGADGAGRRRNPEPDEDGWCTVPTRKR